MADDFVTFDASGAAQEAYNHVTRQFVNSGAAGLISVQALARELVSYSERFYVRSHKVADAYWVATIHGADEGCVNYGVTLATCFLDPSFIYEL